MSFKEGGWILVLIGTVFSIIGIGVVLAGFFTLSQRNEIEKLPVLTLANLQDSPAGQAGVIEGKVSENNTLLFRGFVAYWQELYEGQDCSRDDDGNTDCTAIWSVRDRQIPSIWIDLPQGRVKVVNNGYELYYPTTWQSQDQLVEFVTKRYSGLEVGKVVFVRGTTVTAADAPSFQAEFIAGVDRAGYLAGERDSARGSFIFGGLFAFIGLALLGGWILSQVLK